MIIIFSPRIPIWFVFNPAVGIKTDLLCSDKVLTWVFKLLVNANWVMLRFTFRIFSLEVLGFLSLFSAPDFQVGLFSTLQSVCRLTCYFQKKFLLG